MERVCVTLKESFHDMKSAPYSVELGEHMARDLERVANLLLVCALATLAQRLVGLVGYHTSLVKGLQANTEKRKAVLSVVFVGAQLMAKQLPIGGSYLLHALLHLHERAIDQLEYCQRISWGPLRVRALFTSHFTF